MSAIIINGGNRAASRLTGVEYEVKKLLERSLIKHDTIRVYQLPAHDLITANYKSNAVKESVEKVLKAKIVFVLTPIYKGSYSGIVKTFLDLLPQKALEDKIVVPLAIGGSIAHLLALEYSLKPVLSILGATQVSSPIFVLDKHVTRLRGDQYVVDEDVTTRINDIWEQVYKNQPLKV